MAIDVVIGVLWAAFWVYWLIAASGSKPSRRQGVGAGIAMRLVVFVVAVVLARAGAFRGASLGATALPLQLAGLVMFLGGLALAVYARLYIGSNWGTPMSEKDDPELVRTGPYQWIRHPIYSGIILASVGTVLAVSTLWIFITVLMAIYFVYSAFVEERRLSARFPTTYPAYRASSRMFIPGLF